MTITIIIALIILISLFIFLTIVYNNEKKQIDYYNPKKGTNYKPQTKNISITKIIIALLIFYFIIKYIIPIIEFKILYNLIFN